ncbi:hypothetical protein K8B83_18900 [Shewanella inventionis]|uniref:hypothetical protein n=1 Tax=Shewanella inventionis TaxID=1738770 RepID=UPI001CBF16D5|nr:hypothetical protein [Shewanella inventionis]UAL42861.1 hypothetical protein K8B83_18900 [Shewanella inventionis]
MKIETKIFITTEEMRSCFLNFRPSLCCDTGFKYFDNYWYIEAGWFWCFADVDPYFIPPMVAKYGTEREKWVLSRSRFINGGVLLEKYDAKYECIM